jgi:predicted Zn-dependent peptidase
MAHNSDRIRLPKRNVSREVLPNGTTFLYAPNPYNQIVAIRIYSRLASLHEKAEKAGMANLCMRLLSAGTEKHGEEEIAENLERNGAHFKAEAGKDWSNVDLLTTTYFLRDDLQTVIELLDCPTFLEEKLTRERELVRMSILEQEDSRMTFTMRIFSRNFFGSHPYAWPNLGLIETLDNIQRDDLTPFAHAAFDPSNLVVSVVGGTEKNDVQKIIRECLAARPSRNSKSVTLPPAATPAFDANKEVLVHRDSEAEYLVLGYPGPKITETSSVALRLVSALLGGSMDSRLFREIRDKRGLCYQIGSGYSPQMDLSPLLIYAVTSPANRAETVSCSEAEIERLKEESIEEEELDRVKTFACGSYVMAMETNMGQASRYGTYEMAGLGWDYANQLPDQISAVSAVDIAHAAQQFFTMRLLTITAPPEKSL